MRLSVYSAVAELPIAFEGKLQEISLVLDPYRHMLHPHFAGNDARYRVRTMI